MRIPLTFFGEKLTRRIVCGHPVALSSSWAVARLVDYFEKSAIVRHRDRADTLDDGTFCSLHSQVGYNSVLKIPVMKYISPCRMDAWEVLRRSSGQDHPLLLEIWSLVHDRTRSTNDGILKSGEGPCHVWLCPIEPKVVLYIYIYVLQHTELLIS